MRECKGCLYDEPRYDFLTGMTCDFISRLHARLSESCMIMTCDFIRLDGKYTCAARSSLPGVRFIPKRVAAPCLLDTDISFPVRNENLDPVQKPG